MMDRRKTHIAPLAALLAFVGALGFFQLAYPYHLMRREQMNLFVWDWDYIRQTYGGTGWLARFCCDFLDQFFHLPLAGPVLVALALTAIGIVSYKILRHLTGPWPALGVAALVYAWSFLRETENLFSTRYTLVVLGYLSLVLLALQLRKAWAKGAAAVLLVAFGCWALGAPAHKYYGKWWGTPSIAYDRMIGLDTEVARENWDRVLRLSQKDLHMTEASYCYNLANAMEGHLGAGLFKHSQNGVNSLFIRISTDKSPFSNGLAGEVWYQLGDMTLAEQSAIIALQASPKHTGARFLKRLAQTSLRTGNAAGARKHLGLLSGTLFYGKWAREQLKKPLEGGKPLREDFVHYSTRPRPVLLGLLEENPGNTAAREYLLCTDLMNLDLEHFMEDFPKGTLATSVYEEAVLIQLSLEDKLEEKELLRYGLDSGALDRMERFFRDPDRYRSTYWYYYLEKMNEE